MQNVFVARQPVFNNQLGVYAYELLFRAADHSVRDVDPTRATSQVLVNAFVELGLDRLVSGRKAVINVTAAILPRLVQLDIEPEQMILDLPCRFPQHPKVLEVLQHLSDKGFVVAMSDLAFGKNYRAMRSLVDIIKVDVRRHPANSLERHLKMLSKSGQYLLAEKVESLAEYDHMREIGFDYVQGFFLGRPRVVRGQALPANWGTVMRLLAAVQHPETETKSLERLINQDLNLSYKLLRVVNSAFFGLPREVESVSQAIVMLGRQRLAAWVSMIALCQLNHRTPELIQLSLIRARMCEELAIRAHRQAPESYFTVGMFSALDALLDQPLHTLVEPLPLSANIKMALLSRQGELGRALGCVIAYENGNREAAGFDALSIDECTQAYLAAIDWARDVGALM
ncbi:MAG: HDOD domain-containing protein [Pseudomonadota bacterium]|nr:HDOD domain-containing protein [Pseudomonadota bacterium]